MCFDGICVDQWSLFNISSIVSRLSSAFLYFSSNWTRAETQYSTIYWCPDTLQNLSVGTINLFTTLTRDLLTFGHLQSIKSEINWILNVQTNHCHKQCKSFGGINEINENIILSYNEICLGWNSLGWNMLIFAFQTVNEKV